MRTTPDFLHQPRIDEWSIGRALGALTLAGLAYVAGYTATHQEDPEQAQPPRAPHATEQIAVYGEPFGRQPEDIVAYLNDGPFDLTCAYRQDDASTGPVTDREARVYHISGTNVGGDAVVGFVDATPRIRVGGTTPDC